MTALRLVTDDASRELVERAATGSLMEQLLASVVLSLAADVKRLAKKVADLEGREEV